MWRENKITILRFFVRVVYIGLLITGVLTKDWVFLFIYLSALLCGAIFCGWLCPMGFLQDSIRYIGKFIKKQPFELAAKNHNILKYNRYLLLAGGLLAAGGLFVLSDNTLSKIYQLLQAKMTYDFAFYFFIIIVVLSLFASRFFCRYFCTFGARLGLYSLVRPITINKNPDTCVSCELCSKECLMGIKVDKINSLFDPNCVNCLTCVECCPTKSLSVGVRNYLKP